MNCAMNESDPTTEMKVLRARRTRFLLFRALSNGYIQKRNNHIDFVEVKVKDIQKNLKETKTRLRRRELPAL